MSDVLFSMLWCVVQVSVIAGLACGFSLFVMKGSAKSAARLLAGTASVLGLSGLQFAEQLPQPGWRAVRPLSSPRGSTFRRGSGRVLLTVLHMRPSP